MGERRRSKIAWDKCKVTSGYELKTEFRVTFAHKDSYKLNWNMVMVLIKYEKKITLCFHNDNVQSIGSSANGGKEVEISNSFLDPNQRFP